MSARDRLLQLESEFWEAAGSPEFYDAHFADDGLMAFTVGVLAKPEVLSSVQGASGWYTYTLVMTARGGDLGARPPSADATVSEDEAAEGSMS